LLPAELSRKIRDRARRERRFFTQQTVVLLETALDPDRAERDFGIP
jgi:hypothetical protein